MSGDDILSVIEVEDKSPAGSKKRRMMVKISVNGNMEWYDLDARTICELAQYLDDEEWMILKELIEDFFS